MDAGALSGISGNTLFVSEYSLFDKSFREENVKILFTLVTEIVTRINSNSIFYSNFHEGLTGILIALSNLNKQWHFFKKSDLNTLIKPLQERSLSETISGNCDILHGGLGFLVYLIENPDTPQWKILIDQQLTALDQISEDISCDYRKWKISERFLKIPQQSVDPEGTNFGLAHGLTGIVILNCKLRKLGFNHPLIFDNIKKGMNYILSHKLTTESISLYPGAILHGIPLKDARLAWCNGDLCVALAALHTYEATLDSIYLFKAIEIAQHAANINYQDSYVQGSGVCHGSTGLSYIFHEIYKRTGHISARSAAEKWLKISLSELKEMVRVDNNINHDFSLLNGLTGVGLAYISVLKKNSTKWSSMLLIE